ncbi:MAG: SdrD B-like domain-containing protein [Patescibacteria group bacterium]
MSVSKSYISNLSLLGKIISISTTLIFLLTILLNTINIEAAPTIGANLFIEKTGSSLVKSFESGNCGDIPSPGDDYCDSDVYVRNGDRVEFRIDVSVNDADADQLTISLPNLLIANTEPLAGQPIFSKIENKSIECINYIDNSSAGNYICSVGQVTAGSNISIQGWGYISNDNANYSDINLQAVVESTNSDNTITAVNSNTVNFFTSGRPEWNILHNPNRSFSVSTIRSNSGELGYYVRPRIIFAQDNNKIGIESLSISETINFNINQFFQNNVNKALDVELISFNFVNQTAKDPCPHYNSGTNSIVTFSCTQASAGDEINIEMNIVEPSRLSEVELVPQLFVPHSNVTSSPGEMIINEIKNFDPNSISGASNYGAGIEDTSDNNDNFYLPRVSSTGVIEYEKWYEPNANTNNFTSTTREHVVLPNQSVISNVSLQTRSTIDLNNNYICDNIDNIGSVLHTGLFGNNTGGGQNQRFISPDGYTALYIKTFNTSLYLPPTFNFQIEYGTGGKDGIGNTWASLEDQRTSNCSDSQSPVWYDNVSDVPGGVENITKVRAVIPKISTIADTQGQYVNYILQTGLKTKSVISGQIHNFGLVDSDNISGNFITARDPLIFTSYTSWGLYDRLNVVDAIPYNTISTSTPTLLNQNPITMKNEFYLSAIDSGSDKIQIVNSLPQFINYVPGSATYNGISLEPIYIDTQPGGSSIITWQIDSLEYSTGNTPSLNEIEFQLVASSFAPNISQTTLYSRLNTLKDPAPIDNFYIDCRIVSSCSNDQLAVQNLTNNRFEVRKTNDKPEVLENESINYNITYTNYADNQVSFIDIIDILPYSGDDNGSQFSGSSTLDNIVLNDNSTQSLLYTKDTPSDISNDPCDPKNIDLGMTSNSCNSNITGTGNTLWCSSLSGNTCPSSLNEVTAVRVLDTNLASNNSRSFDITLDIQNNDVNSVYYNQASARVDTNSLLVLSESSGSIYPRGSISGKLWMDANGNEVIDPGETLVSNTRVKILDQSDNLIDEADTDFQGSYSFNNLLSGTYKIVSESTLTESYDTDGINTPNESIVTIDITDANSRDVNSVSFGYQQSYSISGYVYEDMNLNSTFDSGETGDTNWTVSLLDENDNILDTVNLANDYSYTFNNLALGSYKVVFNEYLDYQLEDHDSEKDYATTLVLDDTTSDYSNVNFGTARFNSISGKNYAEEDQDGIDEGDQTPIPNVTINLTGNDLSGNSVSRMTTSDNNGDFEFNSLEGGSYTVTQQQPIGYNDGNDYIDDGSTKLFPEFSSIQFDDSWKTLNTILIENNQFSSIIFTTSGEANNSLQFTETESNNTTGVPNIVTTVDVSNPTPNVGNTIEITVSVENENGAVDLTELVMSGILPEGLRFVSFNIEGVTGTYDEINDIWTITSTLPANQQPGDSTYTIGRIIINALVVSNLDQTVEPIISAYNGNLNTDQPQPQPATLDPIMANEENELTSEEANVSEEGIVIETIRSGGRKTPIIYISIIVIIICLYPIRCTSKKNNNSKK